MTASVLLTLAVSTAAFAQGKSQEHKKPSPPSRSELPPATATIGAASGTSPLAWIDDANLLDPGVVMLAVSTLRWQGGGTSELNAPVIDAAIGLGRRLQLSASVPRVVGSSDPSGAVGGLGTTFVSAKVGVLNANGGTVKVAAMPTVEILSPGAVTDSGSTNRTKFGLPATLEIDRGDMRLYGSGGFFTGGIRFMGGGVGKQLTPRFGVSGSVSRSWTAVPDPDPTLPLRSRNELSGGASFALTDQISAFGSLGHTFATLDENGAGMTISGGLSFLLPGAVSK